MWRIALAITIVVHAGLACAEDFLPSGVPVDQPIPSGATPSAHASSFWSQPAAPTVADRLIGDRLNESTWYTREEYFHWNERFGGADFVNEYGVMVTLGYQKRLGMERYRAELFGGTLNYKADIEFEDGTSEPMSSKTGYLGVRGEYDLLFEPEQWPNLSLLVGIGTRFWLRDLRDGATEAGTPVIGYQETWWTIYPYLGAETRRTRRDGLELYASGRIGFTPVTYEHATLFDATLHPKCGITGELEAGLRGRHLFFSAFSEAMSWRQSGMVRDVLQPHSSFFSVGLKAGVDF